MNIKKISTYIITMLMIATIFVSFPTVLADQVIYSQENIDDHINIYSNGRIFAQEIKDIEGVTLFTKVELNFGIILSEIEPDRILVGLSETLNTDQGEWEARQLRNMDELSTGWNIFNFPDYEPTDNDIYLMVAFISIPLFDSTGKDTIQLMTGCNERYDKGELYVYDDNNWPEFDDGTYDLTFKLHGEREEPEEYTLTIHTTGCGDITPSGGTYTEGTTVTLTANPCTDWKFDHWEGDTTGSTNPKTITMNKDKDITAVFTEESTEYFDLTYDIDGQGTVDLNPPSGTYEKGTEVTLTASPSEGWSFSGWTGDILDNRNPTTINMNSDIHTTAHFEEEQTEELNVDAGGPYFGAKGNSIQFDCSVTGGSGSYQYLWNFGDDATSNEQNPTHSYSKTGPKTVTLTVMDSNDKENKANDDTTAAIGQSYSHKYAIVLRGPSEANWDETELDLAYDNMQAVLNENGFDVYPLYKPDLADLNNVCQDLRRAEKDDLFVLAMMGHGVIDNGEYKFYLNDGPWESEMLISETKLSDFINNIKCTQIVSILSCHSGGCIDSLSKSDDNIKRIVMTSCKEDEVTYSGLGGGWLVSVMEGFLGKDKSDLDGNGYVSIEEIFRYASKSIDSSCKILQHPLLDDNGKNGGHTITDPGYTTIPNDPTKDGFFSSVTTLDLGPGTSKTLSKQKTIEYPLINRLFSGFPVIQQLFCNLKNQYFPNL